MNQTLAAWARGLSVALALAACGGGATTNSSKPVADTMTSTDVPTSTDAVTTDADDTAGSTDGADVTEDVDATGGGVAQNACKTSGECGAGKGCHEGMCISEPADQVTITDNTTDDLVDEAPNFDCVGEQIMPPAGTKNVTVYGIVDRFGGGRKTLDIEVSIFPESEWPPAGCAEEPDLVKQHDCFRNAKPSNPKWVVMATDPGTAANGQDCVRHADCPTGYECIEQSSLGNQCEANYGLYEIPEVPTDTMLVVRAKNTKATLEKKWKDTYVYHQVALSAYVEAGDRYHINALMVSDGQWQTVPNTLLVQGGIKANHGAVGGRVRDCPTAARRGYTLGNVSLGLDSPGTATGYFNNNEEDTVPLLNRTSTDIFGRFTIVDVKPGPNRIAGLARQGESFVSLGAESFFLPPDSLVIVTFPGKLPIFTKN
jgi:hypothetical protein